MDLLVLLLPPNPYLTSLKVDCCRLDDSAIKKLIRPSLYELFLHNCGDFSGRLLSEIGAQCRDLRYDLSSRWLFIIIGMKVLTLVLLLLFFIS